MCGGAGMDVWWGGRKGEDWKKLRYGLELLIFLWILMAFYFACIFFLLPLLARCLVNVLFVAVCGLMESHGIGS